METSYTLWRPKSQSISFFSRDPQLIKLNVCSRLPSSCCQGICFEETLFWSVPAVLMHTAQVLCGRLMLCLQIVALEQPVLLYQGFSSYDYLEFAKCQPIIPVQCEFWEHESLKVSTYKSLNVNICNCQSAERHKMRSQLTAQLMPFFRLIARVLAFRDKSTVF